MRALICSDLVERIGVFFNDKDGIRADSKFMALAERIAGKEVDLVFIGEDAFEAIDNDYWLPDCCWEEVK